MTGKTVGSIRRTSNVVPAGSDGRSVDRRLDLQQRRRSCPGPSRSRSRSRRCRGWWSSGCCARRESPRTASSTGLSHLDGHPLGRAVAGVEAHHNARKRDLRKQADRQNQQRLYKPATLNVASRNKTDRRWW